MASAGSAPRVVLVANGADDHYRVCGRVANAVDVLATSPRSIEERVKCAGLELAHLRAEEFTDPEGRGLFEEIREALTRVEGEGDQGSIAATTTQLSDEEAAELARKIVLLDFVYRPV